MSNIQHVPCSLAKFSQEEDDSNLEKVKVTVMHTGVNDNKSHIADDVADNAKDTLKNIPILAYIKRDDDGQALDFDQHNIITKIVSGDNGHEVKQYYLERPIGLIPETNNYRVEEIDGQNYSIVDGYIWKCYANEGYDLITEAGEKSVSMEISIEDGEKDKLTGNYKIKKYSYLGVTVLGDDVTPAMGYNCKLETYSSNEEFKQAMEELSNEVKKYQKEVQPVEDNKQTEPVVEPVVEPTQEPAQEPVSTEPVEPTQSVEGEPVQEPQQANFSLSVENMSQSIRNTLRGMTIQKQYSWGETYETQSYYLRTIIPSDNIAVMEDNSSNTYSCYGVPYSFEGDNIKLDFDNKKEYIEVWREKEVGEQVMVFSEKQEDEDKIVNAKFSKMEEEITGLKAKLETKETEISELMTFKLQKDKEALTEEVNNVVAQFSELEEEEYADIKAKALNGEISVDTLKFNLYAFKGMKQEALEKEQGENGKFSKQGGKVVEPVRVAVTSNTQPEITNSRYGSLTEELARISGNK